MTRAEIRRIQKICKSWHEQIERSIAITDYTEEGVKIRKALEFAQAYLIDVLNV